ncbi:MAG: hydroxymethylglutaryl-CoA reductase, degradative [Thaumarchaeota archaeon]|jgi:hydroxymethylglutaryl-CoA reductase|nr:hydroxymethylglutaryl-CoA reductase, degradative [Nitrososphaerota archaeon]
MSSISGFYKMSIEERRELLKKLGYLTDEDIQSLNSGGLEISVADKMIENVIGIISYPLGIATNFLINGKDVLVPMSLEEPSVVAAASKAAKIARSGGGFTAEADEPIMIGTIQFVEIKDINEAVHKVMEQRENIKRMANEMLPEIIKKAGGFEGFDLKVLYTDVGEMLELYFYVHVLDAMGANTIDTVAEGLAPYIADLVKGRYLLRILSNYALKRIARARAKFPIEELGKDGDRVAMDLIYAYNLAKADVFRAVTHNKGIMNGIIAIANAINNDTRAIEAGAHSYASRTGKYQPLTDYRIEGNYVVGQIELPLQVATVGGSVGLNKVNKIALKLMGNPTSKELAEIMASVGLAQNFAALLALVTEGIQKGHMKLHARSLALSAGARLEEIDTVVNRMIELNSINFDTAKKVIEEIRNKG